MTADRAKLEGALANAFADGGQTRAVVVVQGGAIVAERYAPGYNEYSRFQSYSVAKSITAALAGIAVRKGMLKLDEPAKVPQWRLPEDPRRAITLRHMLNMSTGLAWRDDYSDLAGSNVYAMLFGSGRHGTGDYAAEQPLVYRPGSRWAYSNGTSNIIATMVGRAVGGPGEPYRQFIANELFRPLGMRSAIAEFDAGGFFMGSSFVVATAQDYARFGLLYLRDGVWNGRRILPAGWVDFTRTPAPNAPDRRYGAHFWLGPNEGGTPPGKGQWPEDAFAARGLFGQTIAIVPSRDLIVVKLGNRNRNDDDEDEHRKVAAIVNAFAAIPLPAARQGN